MSSIEQAANLAAKFHPISHVDENGDTGDELPCIEVAGAVVFAYVKDGYLRVSIDLDTTEPWLVQDAAGQSLIPVHVACQGDDIWKTAPDGNPPVRTDRERIEAALAAWNAAAEGDSGDAEYEAGAELADILSGMVAL
jgi:hypothetical protein